MYSTLGTWHLPDITSWKLWQSWPINFITQQGKAEKWDRGETVRLDVRHCQDCNFYLEGGSSQVFHKILVTHYYFYKISLSVLHSAINEEQEDSMQVFLKWQLHGLHFVSKLLNTPLHCMLLYNCFDSFQKQPGQKL